MRNRILIWTSISISLIGVFFVFEWMRVPCRGVIEYTVGAFDDRFGITREGFREAIGEAEGIWEGALGRDLFRYAETALLPVNLVFDERQERTIDERKLESVRETVESVQGTIREEYNALVGRLTRERQSYELMLSDLEQRLGEYNKRVEEWNDGPRTDDDELGWLGREEKRLRRDQRALDEKRDVVNALVAMVNRSVDEEEKVVEHYNAEVEEFAETYGTGETFDQGMYQGKSIDIYQFDDQAHLVRVLAHELGHALGLEHVENPQSIMYPILEEQSIHNLVPSAEDRAEFARVCSVGVWDVAWQDLRAWYRIVSR